MLELMSGVEGRIYLLSEFVKDWMVHFPSQNRTVCFNDNSTGVTILNDWPLLAEWVKLTMKINGEANGECTALSPRFDSQLDVPALLPRSLASGESHWSGIDVSLTRRCGRRIHTSWRHQLIESSRHFWHPREPCMSPGGAPCRNEDCGSGRGQCSLHCM